MTRSIHLPNTLRTRVLEQVVLPTIGRITRSRFWEKYQHLLADKGDGNDAAAQDRIRRFLIDVFRENDFHRNRFLAAGIDEDCLQQSESILPVLSALPVLTKNDIESAFPDRFLSNNVDAKDLRMTSTRGTAQRLTVVRDFERRDVDRAVSLFTHHMTGGYRVGMPMVEIPPEVCDVVCGELGELDDGPVMHVLTMIRQRNFGVGQWRDLRGSLERHWLYNRKTYPPFGHHGSSPPPEVLDTYLDRLKIDQPFVLKGLSNYLFAIAKRQISRGGPELSIPVIRPLGSAVTTVMKETLETAFGGKYFGDYGSAELGSVACECERRNGMHVHPSLFYVEILDANHNRVPNGVTGEVVVSDLANLAMPFIRYKVGDIGSLTTTPCPCGRASPRLNIVGRTSDAILGAQGEFVSSSEIADLIFSHDDVCAFQLTQKSEKNFHLAVVGGATDGMCQQELVKLLGDDVNIRTQKVRTIRPETGGKFRWVKPLATKPMSKNS